MLTALLFIAAVFLAYWNGANDNFKGVATLYGSGTTGYGLSLGIATVATFAGSIAAIFLAQGLIDNFSGKGLVPAETTVSAQFLFSVGMGAALTVLLATFLGFPISTTHALVGGLTGSGLMAVGSQVNLGQLGSVFFIPLLASPFIALALGAGCYWLFTTLRKRMQLTKETCICIGESKEFVPVADAPASVMAAAGIADSTRLTLAESDACADLYTDRVMGLRLQRLLDYAHVVSGATVSFARGLNDTPKIAGLLVAVSAFDLTWGLLAIATGMAVGGLLHARRVAEKMSRHITDLNHGQGFSANLATAALVLFASKIGVPVSTTHCSVGAIFGIGAVNGKADKQVVSSIVASWVITLPVAVALSAACYLALSPFVA